MKTQQIIHDCNKQQKTELFINLFGKENENESIVFTFNSHTLSVEMYDQTGQLVANYEKTFDELWNEAV
jgi:hypothetical protein